MKSVGHDQLNDLEFSKTFMIRKVANSSGNREHFYSLSWMPKLGRNLADTEGLAETWPNQILKFPNFFETWVTWLKLGRNRNVRNVLVFETWPKLRRNRSLHPNLAETCPKQGVRNVSETWPKQKFLPKLGRNKDLRNISKTRPKLARNRSFFETRSQQGIPKHTRI